MVACRYVFPTTQFIYSSCDDSIISLMELTTKMNAWKYASCHLRYGRAPAWVSVHQAAPRADAVRKTPRNRPSDVSAHRRQFNFSRISRQSRHAHARTSTSGNRGKTSLSPVNTAGPHTVWLSMTAIGAT